eukprot:GDKK01041213.1.p1 GENE.GDKK01041213.1~~GDKK01041213.1.p1  ORF type:complete len:855 (-),score=200.00 GDKK01041213.1:76-2538(-)
MNGEYHEVEINGVKKKRVFAPAQTMKMYTAVHNACSQRGDQCDAKQFHGLYQKCLHDFLEAVVSKKLADLSDYDLLKGVATQWIFYQNFFYRPLLKCLFYIERHSQLNSLDSLYYLSVRAFDKVIIQPHIAEIKDAYMKSVRLDRDGQQVDRECLKKITEITIALGTKSGSSSLSSNRNSVFNRKNNDPHPLSVNKPSTVRDVFDLEVYRDVLEKKILSETQSYYSVKSSEWLGSMTVGQYLERVEIVLKEEAARVQDFLDMSTLMELKSVLVNVLLKEPSKELLSRDSSVRFMIANDLQHQIELMFRMFSLIDNSNGVQAMADVFREYIQEEAGGLIDAKTSVAVSSATNNQQDKEEVKTEESKSNFVESVLDLHDRFKEITHKCTQNDSRFQLALKKAMEYSLNKVDGGVSDEAVSFAHLLAKYVDSLLKKGGCEKSSEESWLLAQFDRVVDVFAFVTDKDVFAEAHRSNLAKRLLNETSLGDYLEKMFISRLKIRNGSQFTSKFEGMLNDLTTARDVMISFEQQCNQIRENDIHLASQSGKEPISDSKKSSSAISDVEIEVAKDRCIDEFQVQVLTTGFWPSPLSLELKIEGTVFEKCAKAFTNFYNRQNGTKRLEFVFSLGSVIVRGHYDRIIEFMCVPCQAIALLCFNTHKEGGWTIVELAKMMGMDSSMAKKVIATLCFAKGLRILKKIAADEATANKATIASDDKFVVNTSFTASVRRLKLPVPALMDKEAKSGAVSGQARVEEDRSHQIDAAIVRIMKANRVMSSQDLINEVQQQLQFFKPHQKVIKLRFDSLLERDYMKRDTDTNKFVYVA